MIELSAYGIKELVFRSGTKLGLQAFPGIRPGFLNPSDEVWGVDRFFAVVVLSNWVFIDPVIATEVLADLVFEGFLEMNAHTAASSPGTNPRTSIWPVTADEIRADRRSFKRSEDFSAASIRSRKISASLLIASIISSCS